MPACVLTPPGGSGHGLQAEYFDNADFQGEPKLLRVEPRIFQQADLPDPAVAAAFPDGGYSVRWSGTLRVSASGDYAFSSRGGSGPSGIRISLDGQELAAPAPTAPAPTAPAPAAPTPAAPAPAAPAPAASAPAAPAPAAPAPTASAPAAPAPAAPSDTPAPDAPHRRSFTRGWKPEGPTSCASSTSRKEPAARS